MCLKTNMPFKIDRDCLYSKQDLQRELEQVGLDVDTFLMGLQPRKLFRSLWLGEHLLEACRTYQRPEKPVVSLGTRTTRKPRASTRRTSGTEKRIGRFTREEVGMN